MGLFDKLKNMFTEEVEEEEKEPIKKEVFQVEIPAPKIEEKKERKEEKEEPKKEEIKREEKFVFPVYFDDSDFEEPEPPKRAQPTRPVVVEPKPKAPVIKKPEPKKVFKPSPVISPVYGVLDKNYSKEDIGKKDGLVNDYDTKVDIDYVINKAYGEVKTREEKHRNLEEKPIDIFEEKTSVVEVTVKEDIPIEELDEKIKSIDELLKDTTEDDFYSLVDSMYKDEEGDEA